MGFSEAIRTCFSKYATFVGRAPRSEYWFFVLFNLLVNLVGFLIDSAVGSGLIISDLIGLVLFLPSLAVWVRRLHDIDRTGWWVVLPLVPSIGLTMLLVLNPASLYGLGALIALVALVIWVVLLVWACTRGTLGPNRFGPDPLAGAIGTAAA